MKISIIIPVYNVVKWIDECLKSVVNQSFKDFEVILVNDGSTDGSLEKCLHWEEQDSRIKVLSQKNSGPSIARNKGIKEAKGDYLSFIDADDWIDRDFLKKLYDAVVENDADMAECDFYRVDDRNGEMGYRLCSGSIGLLYTFEEHMIYGNLSIWKCLIKRKMFEIYAIEFPNCHSEAKAIYPLLLALSNKIVNVQEALYYYRRFRENSLTANPRKNKGDELAIGLNAFDALIDGFKKNNIYEEYKSLLEKMIKNKLSDILAGGFYRKTKDDYIRQVKKYRDYIDENFSNSLNFPYITFGGYNLNRILWNMNILHDSYCRFNFSSLISVMNPLENELEFSHKNYYREMMMSRDIYGSLWDVMNEVKPKCIFIDLIEERFDIIRYRKVYLTKSDAFDTAEIDSNEMQIVWRDSIECLELWKCNCIKFIKKLAEDFPETKVVLIKNFLSKGYGDVRTIEKYSEICEIIQTNRILSTYYDFFEKQCPNAIVIEAIENEPYITDVKYEYGVIPSHLNDFVNRKIAKQIEKEVFSRI